MSKSQATGQKASSHSLGSRPARFLQGKELNEARFWAKMEVNFKTTRSDSIDISRAVIIDDVWDDEEFFFKWARGISETVFESLVMQRTGRFPEIGYSQS